MNCSSFLARHRWQGALLDRHSVLVEPEIIASGSNVAMQVIVAVDYLADLAIGASGPIAAELGVEFGDRRRQGVGIDVAVFELLGRWAWQELRGIRGGDTLVWRR